MERIEGINFERIKWCCNEYSVTLEEMASKLHIGESSIERLKSGESSLTFNQLRNIGDYFGRGMLFFLEPGKVNENNIYSPQLRSISNRKGTLSREVKLLIERVENHREIYLDLIEETGEEVIFQPPELGSDPSDAAAIARQWILAGSESTFEDYRSAMEDKGIFVFRSNGYKGKWYVPNEDPVLGFSLYYDKCPTIFVRKQDAPVRQTFTLAHELGHILLHQESYIDDDSDLSPRVRGREAEANNFAGKFLVPDDRLDSIDDLQRPDNAATYEEWLKPNVREWGVSYEVILRRLMDAGRLSQEQYDQYRKWKQAVPKEDKRTGRGSRRRYLEPKDIFGSRYVATILDSLSARNITLNKASQYLDNLKVSDIGLLRKDHVDI